MKAKEDDDSVGGGVNDDISDGVSDGMGDSVCRPSPSKRGFISIFSRDSDLTTTNVCPLVR